MTTDKNLDKPVCSTVPQIEMTLLEQIQWVLVGHRLEDVAQVAIALLIESAVQPSASKAQALRILDGIYINTACEINEHYDEMRGNAKTVRYE